MTTAAMVVGPRVGPAPRPGINCRKCREGIAHEFTHGANGYKYHQCRCDVCRRGICERNQDYNDRNREAVREYKREYQERNREAIRERQREYEDRNREAVREYRREYANRNREAIRERNRDYCERNRRVIRERKREYQERNREAIRERKREYEDRNREAIRERNRDYCERNRDYLNRQHRKRRARLASIPGPRNGSRWTAAEDAIVTRADLSMIEMCYMLGRSHASIALHRMQLRRKGVAVG